MQYSWWWLLPGREIIKLSIRYINLVDSFCNPPKQTHPKTNMEPKNITSEGCFFFRYVNTFYLDFQISGQILIFHQPRFPWNRRFPLLFTNIRGEIGRVRSRPNLTTRYVNTPSPTSFTQVNIMTTSVISVPFYRADNVTISVPEISGTSSQVPSTCQAWSRPRPDRCRLFQHFFGWEACWDPDATHGAEAYFT